MWLLLMCGGLVALTVGAELLVRGASSLAAAARVSPLVIGLTVVAFGTSAPELVVSTHAALDGQADLSIGNVLGSNIFNVLFILGLSAVITPLVVSRQIIRLDVPVMIVVSLVTWALAADSVLGRIECLALLICLLGYTTWLIVQSRRELQASARTAAADFTAADTTVAASETSTPIVSRPIWLCLVLAAAGLALLILGSRWFTHAAVDVARMLGAPELVIGLTIVAAGTSLPEVATSVMAAIRGQRDIAVGNVVGSNVFNLLGVLGAAGVMAPGGIPVSSNALQFDFPVMVAVAIACLPVFMTEHQISRREGFLFLAYYVFYTSWLILETLQHVMRDTFRDAMTYFVIPLTIVTMLTGILRNRRMLKHRANSRS